jgi:uncharacterized protein YndB with AHSA1/START domain
MAKTPDATEVRVEQRISAAPEALYALISDVTNMGRWSPENHACTWIKGARGPVVGARFKGSNKDGWRRWSTVSQVVAADPGRRFAFDTRFIGVSISRWSYDFEADGDGTRVVETWEDRRPKLMRSPSKVVMGVPDRPGHNRAGMEATLAALKESAETV